MEPTSTWLCQFHLPWWGKNMEGCSRYRRSASFAVTISASLQLSRFRTVHFPTRTYVASICRMRYDMIDHTAPTLLYGGKTFLFHRLPVGMVHKLCRITLPQCLRLASDPRPLFLPAATLSYAKASRRLVPGEETSGEELSGGLNYFRRRGWLNLSWFGWSALGGSEALRQTIDVFLSHHRNSPNLYVR